MRSNTAQHHSSSSQKAVSRENIRDEGKNNPVVSPTHESLRLLDSSLSLHPSV